MEMEVQALGQNSTSNVKSKHDAVVKRVQTEFLSQINEGKSEKEAFLNALHAIDSKYNPVKDEVKLAKTERISATPESAKKWLEVIAIVVPMLENFIDWILDKFSGHKNNNDNPPMKYASPA